MSYRILIVDDSRVMRAVIARTVTLSGIEVECIEQAPNGAIALEMLRATPFDIVLLDINMPVMDGEQLLAAIRSDPKIRDISVIVASTESSDTRIRRLRLMGAEFIHKPFRPEELALAVTRVAEAGR
jgi:two-component system chemotaxis response regulator CheY